MDDSIKVLLFSLLRNALWQTEKGVPKELAAEAADGLLRTAEAQTVTGLVAEALMDRDVRMPREKVFEAIGRVAQTQQTNGKMNGEMRDFATRMVGDYVVVKGQTIGCLYPKPLLRMSGDIDFLVKEDYDTVRETVGRALDVELPKVMNEREIGFDRNGVRYELHTCLRTFACKRHQRCWDALMDEEWAERHDVEIEGCRVRTLSPTMNAVYVFVHLFFHLIREGVALRQFCDWTMVLHHYRGEIDRQRLKELLEELDLLKAYRAFGTVVTDCLGLPQEEFPCVIDEKDRRWKDRILDDVFAGGNFGKLNHQARDLWRFKLETLRVALRNSFRYYSLCPSEVGGMIPRLVKLNMRLMMNG